MAYDESLALRVRHALALVPDVVEKRMMGGLTFMVNDKMCVGILKDELMCRIDPSRHDEATAMPGCRTMDFTGRRMEGYILVEPSFLESSSDLKRWVEMALDFNARAKSSKRAKKAT